MGLLRQARQGQGMPDMWQIGSLHWIELPGCKMGVTHQEHPAKAEAELLQESRPKPVPTERCRTLRWCCGVGSPDKEWNWLLAGGWVSTLVKNQKLKKKAQKCMERPRVKSKSKVGSGLHTSPEQPPGKSPELYKCS